MCYDVYMSTRRRRVGMRAMRQSLTTYLRRAEAGETFEVTTRGRPVAVLAPFEAAATPLERLQASGRATQAEGDLLELGPPPKARGRSIARALQEQRGERL
jgi:prevent-host-death family protein